MKKLDLSNCQLSQLQKEVLIGSLLGDGSISLAIPNSNPRFRIERKLTDKIYLEWEYNIFKDLCSAGIKERSSFDKRYNKTYYSCHFKTRNLPCLLDFYKEWYPNNIKQVPQNIELTPTILAVWFADDGCIINHGETLTLKLSTESFGLTGVNLLTSKLEKRYGMKFPFFQKKKGLDQYFIKAATDAARLFFEDIDPILSTMGIDRKYSKWLKFKNGDESRRAEKLKSENMKEDILNRINALDTTFTIKSLCEDLGYLSVSKRGYYDPSSSAKNFIKKLHKDNKIISIDNLDKILTNTLLKNNFK